ncbi:Thermospermine synthase ACAULIS5 [Glycine max]|uniref:Thermospermine synthase ACAULIS5 n=1 Tax=Glycine soja TaxID=3848 RepID=A0A445FSZ7_GLYSO|nr:hypothetical protein JHK86_050160 [Glycine max]KAG4936032.1 hypothetical protein JHK85_050951 [Glycine max]KAH1198448.1 Thermospermine synthase ACAULIS5 [Glycine max]RZB51996.1 Thermospermine synthase ACAULIS5 [Glycine soja]
MDFNASYLILERTFTCHYLIRELDAKDILSFCYRVELEARDESYDVIIGDLPDPIDGACFYTKSFYELIVKPRLKQGGIFVTQAGPAGIFSHTEVFSCIYNTLRHGKYY